MSNVEQPPIGPGWADTSRPPGIGEGCFDDGAVHVWRFALDIEPAQMDTAFGCLSDDERERASRFHFDRDRMRFIAGRAMLRDILGHYLGVDRASLKFAYSANGKPSIAPAGASTLEFNLAHSDGWALCALSADSPVGIDIERIKAEFEFEQIARRFFAPQEADVILGLSAQQAAVAFFEYWARKESYIKALGIGLSMELNRFWIGPSPQGRDLWSVYPTDAESSRWRIDDLKPIVGFTAALCVAADQPHLRVGEWRLFGA